MYKTFHKFKACDTKSIASAIIHLNHCEFRTDYSLNHSQLILPNCKDSLIVEAFNQITTVSSILEDETFSTNFSRYIWKLNPEFSSNKFRLKLLRILKPIGLFFLVRNTNSNLYLTLNNVEYNTFLIKWKSIYPTYSFSCETVVRDSTKLFNIYIDPTFENIIQTAINIHVIDDLENHKLKKKLIIEETISKLRALY